MRRLTAIAIAVASVAATAACTDATLKADDDVALRGTVHDHDGRPLPGARVVLIKDVDLGEAALCLSDQAPARCSRARQATTDGEGGFRFDLKGGDTQGSAGASATFLLATGDADGGPSVTARFQIQRTSITVPTLRLWAPPVELTTGRTIRTTWTARAPGAAERVVFYDGSHSNSNIIWKAEGRSPVNLDGRLLEDTRGTAVVESDATEEASGTTFRLTHRAARTPFTTTAVPPSRNAPCTPEPCALTDGVLTPPDPPPPGRNDVTVDLARSSTPTLIVLRGCPAQCDVETSVDGLAYKVVGSGREPFFTVTPVLGTPVRYVRVKSVNDLSPLAEVSIWLANT